MTPLKLLLFVRWVKPRLNLLFYFKKEKRPPFFIKSFIGLCFNFIVSLEFLYIIRVHLPLAVFHNYGGAKQYQFSTGQYSFTTGHIRNMTLPNAGRSFWFVYFCKHDTTGPKTKGNSSLLVFTLIPPPQKPKTTPVTPTEIPLPPSLSPITTPKILTRSHLATRLSPSPQTPSTSTSSTIHKARVRSASTEARRAINAFYFCEDTFENPHLDRLLKQTLKPLRSLKKIDEKDITNPYLFKDAPMLTTFVRSAGNQTKEL